MNKKFWFGVIGFSIFASYVILKDNAETESQLKAVAAAANLTAQEDQAFRICVDSVKGKTVTHKTDKGPMQLQSVPHQICACQSREMVRQMPNGNYAEHQKIITLFEANDRMAALEKVITEHGPEKGIKTFGLAVSMGSCIQTHFAEIEREVAERRAQAQQKREQVMQQVNLRKSMEGSTTN